MTDAKAPRGAQVDGSKTQKTQLHVLDTSTLLTTLLAIKQRTKRTKKKKKQTPRSATIQMLRRACPQHETTKNANMMRARLAFFSAVTMHH